MEEETARGARKLTSRVLGSPLDIVSTRFWGLARSSSMSTSSSGWSSPSPPRTGLRQRAASTGAQPNASQPAPVRADGRWTGPGPQQNRPGEEGENGHVMAMANGVAHHPAVANASANANANAVPARPGGAGPVRQVSFEDRDLALLRLLLRLLVLLLLNMLDYSPRMDPRVTLLVRTCACALEIMHSDFTMWGHPRLSETFPRFVLLTTCLSPLLGLLITLLALGCFPVVILFALAASIAASVPALMGGSTLVLFSSADTFTSFRRWEHERAAPLAYAATFYLGLACAGLVPPWTIPAFSASVVVMASLRLAVGVARHVDGASALHRARLARALMGQSAWIAFAYLLAGFSRPGVASTSPASYFSAGMWWGPPLGSDGLPLASGRGGLWFPAAPALLLSLASGVAAVFPLAKAMHNDAMGVHMSVWAWRLRQADALFLAVLSRSLLGATTIVAPAELGLSLRSALDGPDRGPIVDPRRPRFPPHPVCVRVSAAWSLALLALACFTTILARIPGAGGVSEALGEALMGVPYIALAQVVGAVLLEWGGWWG